MSKGEFKQAVGRLLLEGACAFSVDGASEIIRSHSRIGEGEGEGEDENQTTACKSEV